MHGTFTTTVQEFCGARFSYRQSGYGDPVLLLHASASTGGSWRGVIGELGGAFSFYTPDLAGYGQSACEYLESKATLRAEAEFVAPLLWEAKEPFHVIGHSFGGAVALAAAMAWPERVKTLTLYEPTVFFVLRDRGGTDREKLDSIVSVAREMERAVAEGEESRAMSRFVDLWSEPGAWDRLPAARQEDFSGLAKKVVCNFHSAQRYGTPRFQEMVDTHCAGVDRAQHLCAGGDARARADPVAVAPDASGRLAHVESDACGGGYWPVAVRLVFGAARYLRHQPLRAVRAASGHRESDGQENVRSQLQNALAL